MSNEFKIAAVQMDIRFAAVEENARRVVEFLKRTADDETDLTVFPECTLTGYCYSSFDEAFENAVDPGDQVIRDITKCCRDLQTATVIGFIEKSDDKIFNTVVLIDGGGIQSTYRKTHLPHLGVDRFTTPGDAPYQVAALGDTRIGLLICYDCSFPEPTRILSLEGADIIVLPTNWPPGSGATADLVPNARAFENHVYFVVANRIGQERDFEFIGKSKICAPNGTTLAFANHEGEAVLCSTLYPATARQKHLVAVPDEHEVHRIDDRRPELYGRITSR